MKYFVDETSLLEDASKRQRDREIGQVSMFDMFAEMEGSGFEDNTPEPDGIEWDKRTLLAYEKEILKIYVSDHPLRPYERALRKITKYQLGSLAEMNKDIPNGIFAGMITAVTVKFTKTNKKMATFVMEDTTGHVEGVVFNYEKFQDDLVEDAIVQIKGKFEHSERGDQLLAYEIERLELGDAEAGPGRLELHLSTTDFTNRSSSLLKRILTRHEGEDAVVLYVQQPDGRKFRGTLPQSVDTLDRMLFSELSDLFGRAVWRAS